MQGYCICTLAGGWKYTFPDPSNASRSPWRDCLWPVVNTSQTQQQTGTLDFDVSHNPQSPHPLNIANGKEVFVGVRVRHNADRIIHREIVIYTIALTEHTSVPNYVTEI